VTSLSIERYRALLAAYGARLELWPADERDAARALLESSAEARELSREEAGLDALFASAEAPALSAGLSRKLAELPVAEPQPRKLWPFRRTWVPALAWAAAAVLGIALGSVAPDPEGAEAATADTAEAAANAASDDAADAVRDADEDESDLLEMALGPAFELEETP
jgi:hypothetical protein